MGRELRDAPGDTFLDYSKRADISKKERKDCPDDKQTCRETTQDGVP